MYSIIYYPIPIAEKSNMFYDMHHFVHIRTYTYIACTYNMYYHNDMHNKSVLMAV